MEWAGIILGAVGVLLAVVQLAVTLLIVLPDLSRLHPKKSDDSAG